MRSFPRPGKETNYVAWDELLCLEKIFTELLYEIGAEKLPHPRIVEQLELTRESLLTTRMLIEYFFKESIELPEDPSFDTLERYRMIVEAYREPSRIVPSADDLAMAEKIRSMLPGRHIVTGSDDIATS